MRQLLLAAIGATGLVLGGAGNALAHPPGGPYQGGYYGNGPHDLVVSHYRVDT
ncbi:MAG TPA: hypothetical protein VKE74_27320 [Gemmataceae bacterium]|nr:hypothetical protein [Gemmataceae bacterium]